MGRSAQCAGRLDPEAAARHAFIRMSDLRNPIPNFGPPPSVEDIAEMAERALLTIPPRLARHVQGVGISVEDMPDDETLDELGIESAWELTGLYHGTPLTEPGSVIGTLAYMAPEQIDGAQPTAAGDLWSLGATLYTALEGRQPFEGDSIGEICVAVYLKGSHVAR